MPLLLQCNHLLHLTDAHGLHVQTCAAGQCLWLRSILGKEHGVTFQIMHAGLHIESIEQAEQQVSLVCHAVKGVEVPFALSMMQVLFFVHCKTHLRLRCNM